MLLMLSEDFSQQQFSSILFWLLVLITEDPLFQEVSGGCGVHGVLCEASLLCSGHVMQTAISKGEMAPDKLITSHVFFRKNSLGLLCPPQLGLTKGHLVSVQDLFQNYSNHQEEQGQYFSQTKNIMTYFTVGLTFCLDPFCVRLGGTSNTMRCLQIPPLSVRKN